MSKAYEALRAIGIFNSYEAAKRGESPIYIAYRAAITGRASQSAAWQVHDARGRGTDDAPKERQHWRDYGKKTFNVYGRDQQVPQKEAAIAWATERYGIAEWGTIPGLGKDLFPIQTVQAVKAAMKEAKSQ